MTSPSASKETAQGRRYHIAYPDGTEATLVGANTALSVLDKPGLSTWKMKRVAHGIANDPDRLELARSWGTCYQAVRACLDESSYEADLGTSVHAVTAAIDLGEPLDWAALLVPTVPREDVEPYVEQWLRCKREHRLEFIAVEQTVYNRTHGYAGTLDRAGLVPALKLDDDLAVIGDVKTGKDVWPDTAMQLAAYAHGEGTFTAGVGPGPMPRVSHDVGVVFHLAPDRYDVIPMDLRDAWRAFLSATQAFTWSSEHGRHAVMPVLAPLEVEEAWPW